MKFSRLSTKFSKLLRKQKKGKTIKPEKLEKLRHLLTEKKSRFEQRLSGELSDDKRDSIQTKLKVVSAHLEKLDTLS